jgi:hypothetical protein
MEIDGRRAYAASLKRSLDRTRFMSLTKHIFITNKISQLGVYKH